jgi:hypothetical protein
MKTAAAWRPSEPADDSRPGRGSGAPQAVRYFAIPTGRILPSMNCVQT